MSPSVAGTLCKVFMNNKCFFDLCFQPLLQTLWWIPFGWLRPGCSWRKSEWSLASHLYSAALPLAPSVRVLLYYGILAPSQWKSRAPGTPASKHSESRMIAPYWNIPYSKVHLLRCPHTCKLERKKTSGTVKSVCSYRPATYLSLLAFVRNCLSYFGDVGSKRERMWPFKDPHLQLHQSQHWPCGIEVCKADLVTGLHKY